MSVFSRLFLAVTPKHPQPDALGSATTRRASAVAMAIRRRAPSSKSARTRARAGARRRAEGDRPRARVQMSSGSTHLLGFCDVLRTAARGGGENTPRPRGDGARARESGVRPRDARLKRWRAMISGSSRVAGAPCCRALVHIHHRYDVRVGPSPLTRRDVYLTSTMDTCSGAVLTMPACRRLDDDFQSLLCVHVRVRAPIPCVRAYALCAGGACAWACVVRVRSLAVVPCRSHVCACKGT